ncbi:MAG: DUF167 domain-containing protein [Alphaproteobacteria bacterium]|jgi:hypothetical protein|nr:DUF167 domain-containing protein [Alphaproteobacteria bacterium]MDP6563601.1 DUF167 domain-containing protein [Alphaproteobacteria bacterium]MDP6815086.1 DUF167 domain-containing protein [Alphaproteobacteria bacterium]
MPFRAVANGVRIAVRLRPGASANRIDGIEPAADGGRRLAVRVTAKPEKGKANKALLRLLAKAWRLPQSRLEVAGGARSRDKQVLLRGEAADAMALLARWRDGQYSSDPANRLDGSGGG